MSHVIVNGIVSHRDRQPYVQLDIDGHLVQMSMAQARSIARDIEVSCARAEADAMIYKFFSAKDYPEGAGAALMIAFRDFRSQLDAEEVERTQGDPDA